MTPDKLFIVDPSKFSDKEVKDPTYCAFESQDGSIYGVEYIKKDALLEWANKRLEEFRHIAEISNDVAADGEVDAFEELIDKLNSM